MRMPEGCADVVVVGARAAGAPTAMLLARAGLSVTVLDRERPGCDTLSTHALMRGGVLQLARWGLLDRLVAAGTPPVRAATFRHSARDVTVPIKPAAGVDALYAPLRTVLDPLLVDAARAAGATVQYETRVTGVLVEHGRVVGVDSRDRQGRWQRTRAGLVIGADGRRSSVADLVSAVVTHRARHTSAFSYGYLRHLAADGYEGAYRPGAMAGFIPTNHGLTCAFAGATPRRIGRGGAAGWRRLVAEASPSMGRRLAAAELCSPVRTFVGLPGYLRRPWGPGWALVGDAGSWKDPISAHGLTDALRDAELLTRAVLSVRAGRPAEEAFGAYRTIRDRLTLPVLTAGDEIAAMRWDDARIVELLGELNVAMAAELKAIECLDAAAGLAETG